MVFPPTPCTLALAQYGVKTPSLYQVRAPLTFATLRGAPTEALATLCVGQGGGTLLGGNSSC